MINIRVNNEILDSFESEVLAVTFAANEIGKLETRQGSSSNTYTLPYTSKNASLLGYPDNINLVNSIPYRKIESELLKDGLLIEKGVLQITDIAPEDKTIQVTFFGGNVDWFNQIKDFKLTEIDLSDIDHLWTEANIVNSWNNTWEDGYIYPIIDHNQGIVVSNTHVTDWFPAVFLRYLIKKGLEQKGFKLGGGLLREALFNKIIIPFSKKDFIDSSELETISGFAERTTPQLISDTTETKIDFTAKGDLADFDLATDRYTASSDQRVKVVFSSSSNVIGQTLRVKKNGVLVDSKSYAPNQNIEFVYELANTDYLEFFIYFDSNGAFASAPFPSFSLEISTTNNLVEGATIPMSVQMPDMEFSDLLRWVAFTFGVVFTYNRFTKTVNFDLFKNISTSDSKDWSNKLINIKRIDFTNFISNYGRENTAKYQENQDDLLLNAYTLGTGNNFGDGTISIDNDFLSGENDLYEAPFAGTVQRSGASGGYLPFIQRYSSTNLNYSEADIDPKPRVLVLQGDISPTNFSVYSTINVGSTTGETSCAYASFYKNSYKAGLDAYTDSLAYSNPILGNPNDVAIFNTSYWNKYLTILASPKFIEAEMFLTEFDIKTFDFMKPVFIERLGAYFFVNKIKEYIGEGTTVVELIKI